MKSEYAAKRLPKHAGPAAWDAILGPRAAARTLDGDMSCDFAVIGAGFAGLAAARRLAQLNAGARIVVLDAGRIGEGAAGRNSGFMIDLPHELTSVNYAGTDESLDRRLIRLNRLAIEFARDAVLEYEIDPNHFDPVGKTNGAGSEVSHTRNQSYAAHLRELRERYELLDAQAMFELTGSRYYLSGLYTPGTVMLQPAGYVRGFAGGLSRVAQVRENSPVTGFRREGSAWRIASPGGSVTAPKVVLANNGQIESFGFKRGRLMHVFLFACMTEELGRDALAKLGGRARWGVTPSDPMGTTMRRIDSGQGGNRIVTRTCAEFRPGMESSSREMRRATAVMRRKFDTRFPQLADVRMEYVWSGHLCLSRNGVSVTGEVEDGIFAACCQNGLGTTRGTLTGISAAELASGSTSSITEYFVAQAEPERLPPEPIATVGANLVLRWKEWLARRE
ncbi:MAG TPA: FAD-binding oxidoreductase [Amaricoccus sp.]|uniref:NAD(P)/FAD-dependent oxidoreductase n=1 Tax=Amaricoccus sp. TaxID=1872485 RepID=UPI002CBF0EAF|nr:FAD-binding oxidoreductase [Amaricoccus sp.]HMQ92163.1 FAD-binding oxidoreductase [Amaricoccus sp.]HMR36567.1 FAD-binding oxidoreductase [Paracoccus sp. (in: a-proteobacteria)]HMR53441.1 FAD-binding oxidoreductase [Amaricoccus sp.]HMU00432.1 FAD-binding oxidoreductase [Amaricoccus sp.]